MIGKTIFKLIVAGSRDFSDYQLLARKCDAVLASKEADPDVTIQIVSGGARGADKLGERYAKERGYLVKVFKPNWEKGKMAGFLRNVDMAEYADALIAFDFGTKGTGHMIKISQNRKMLVRVIKCTPPCMDTEKRTPIHGITNIQKEE